VYRQQVSITRIVFLGAMAAGQAWSQSTGLADATLEQLLNTKVTSVSKKEENLAHTAAAVFVISQEDIRRSGATNLPDVLRMVPGVEVAQINSSSWAITIRGFNQKYADKVLVLVDGRSAYAPSFSGVYWDHLDTPLEDIDRIEVIRGPGGSVWGANAVNGVVNVITKSAKATKGVLATANASTEEDSSVTVQGGGNAGSSGAFRAFAKYTNTPSMAFANGAQSNDGWRRFHGGFRTDFDLSPNDSLTVQGELFHNREGESLLHSLAPVPGDVPFPASMSAQGGDVIARWTHSFANGSSTTLQTYYDQFQRSQFQLSEVERTFDVDFQHHFKLGARQDIVWGLGYRSQSAGLPLGYSVSVSQGHRTAPLYSAFVQDEIHLAPNVWLTLGAKVEHNVYSGFETEPSARIAWNPDAKQTVWASASKAIRQPTRLNTGVSAILETVPLAPGVDQTITLAGNPHFQSEELRDYEVGYRRQWNSRLSMDVDGFMSFYRRLATYEIGKPVIVPGLKTIVQVPVMYGNRSHAVDYGGEASLTFNMNSRWRIAPGFSMLAVNYRLDPSSTDVFSAALAGNSPRHSIQARSSINLTRRLEFDQTVYWNNAFANRNIPAHARVDARLSWKLSESVDVSLTGQNLLRPDFMEFGNFEQIVGTQSPRSLIGKITWHF
jgi:iron complex outermembrane receptor protein